MGAAPVGGGALYPDMAKVPYPIVFGSPGYAKRPLGFPAVTRYYPGSPAPRLRTGVSVSEVEHLLACDDYAATLGDVTLQVSGNTDASFDGQYTISADHVRRVRDERGNLLLRCTPNGTPSPRSLHVRWHNLTADAA